MCVGMRVATSGRPEARYVKILKGVFWPFARGEARTSASAKKTGSSEGGRCPEKTRALAHAAGPGLRLHARDVRGRAAHQQQLDVRHEGEGVEQQLDPLVGLEVAGVEDDRPGAEGQLAPQGVHGLGRRRRPRVHERRVLDLEDGHLRRAGPHPVRQAGADGHRGGGVPQRVALERLGQPEERPAGREAGVAELVGDRRVHVHDERDARRAGRTARSGAPPPRPRGRRRSRRSGGARRPRRGRARRGPSWRATGRPSRVRPGAAGSAGAARPRSAPARPAGTSAGRPGGRARRAPASCAARRAACRAPRRTAGGRGRGCGAGSGGARSTFRRRRARTRGSAARSTSSTLQGHDRRWLVASAVARDQACRRRSAAAATARHGEAASEPSAVAARAWPRGASHSAGGEHQSSTDDRRRHRVPRGRGRAAARPATAACRAGGCTKSSDPVAHGPSAVEHAARRRDRRFRQRVGRTPKAAPQKPLHGQARAVGRRR